MTEPTKTAPPQAAQSPIFVKTHDLLLWLLQHTARFPKSERFRLAKRVDDSAFRFYDLIGRATKSGDKRRSVLLEADLELDRLRLNVRLCVELKLLTSAQYEYAATALVEIGKLLGGWIKTIAA
ncbi:MAG: diversity-generating retroelement protein Avd [Chloroflexi bacterium]|nr:diversity-generating retroelement protein Avd [Chloroflexota bacterium]